LGKPCHWPIRRGKEKENGNMENMICESSDIIGFFVGGIIVGFLFGMAWEFIHVILNFIF